MKNTNALKNQSVLGVCVTGKPNEYKGQEGLLRESDVMLTGIINSSAILLFIRPNLVNEKKVWFLHRSLEPKISTMIENLRKMHNHWEM